MQPKIKARITFAPHSYRLKIPSLDRLRHVACDPSMLLGECSDVARRDKELSSKVADAEHTGVREGSRRRSGILKFSYCTRILTLLISPILRRDVLVVIYCTKFTALGTVNAPLLQ